MNGYRSNHITNYLQVAYQPIEMALKNHDDLGKLLISLGASVDIGILEACGTYYGGSGRLTIKDWVDMAISSLETQIEDKKAEKNVLTDIAMVEPYDEEEKGWQGFYKKQLAARAQLKTDAVWEIAEKVKKARVEKETLEQIQDIKEFFVEMQTLLAAKGAKSWKELYPDIETEAATSLGYQSGRRNGQPLLLLGQPRTDKPKNSAQRTMTYRLLNGGRYGYGYSQHVAEHLLPAYNELFEACYAGDNDTIQRLCLPVEGQGTTESLLNISVRAVNASIGDYEHHG